MEAIRTMVAPSWGTVVAGTLNQMPGSKWMPTVGGNADVVDFLHVGNPVEEGVALDHAAVRDRPEGRRERQRLLGEVDLEDVVVRTSGRRG
jgi:hypothetical protein